MRFQLFIERSSWLYTIHIASTPTGECYAHLKNRCGKRCGAILALSGAITVRDGAILDAAVSQADRIYQALAATLHEPEITSPHSQRPRHPASTG